MAGQRDFEDERWIQSKQTLQYRHRAALEALEKHSNRETRILDVGCGDGVFLEYLESAGYRDLFGVDFSATAVERTRELGYEAEQADLEQGDLPFETNQFEVATMLDVLEHLYHPVEALKEICRVSERLVLCTPNFNSLAARIQVLRGETPEQNQLKKGHVYWINRNELHDVLAKSGFDVMEEDYYIYKQDSEFGRLTRAVGTMWPELFATAFTVVCDSR